MSSVCLRPETEFVAAGFKLRPSGFACPSQRPKPPPSLSQESPEVRSWQDREPRRRRAKTQP